MQRRNSQPATVLITGASDGIGLALARLYQERGMRVVSIGRRPIAELPVTLRVDYCRVDLIQPFAPAVVAAFLQLRNITSLDILIHCAGVGSYGGIASQPAAEIATILHTNIYTPIALTHAIFRLLAAAHGKVVLIGSVAATLPVANYAVYGASKAALEGFARSLRIEARHQCAVQIIHPGATRTHMHTKIGAPLTQIGWQRFPLPEQVAVQIVAAIERGDAVATIGAGNQLLRFAGRWLAQIVDWIAGWQER